MDNFWSGVKPREVKALVEYHRLTQNQFEIRKDQLSEGSNGIFYAEASDVGLKPGEWPDTIWVMDVVDRTRIFDVFRRERATSGAVQYMGRKGYRLELLND